MITYRVSSKTSAGKLAAAIAGAIVSDNIELVAIGAAAVNNALKSVTYAENLLNRTTEKTKLYVRPEVKTITIDDDISRAMVLEIVR